jgi:predicted DNA-binding transcriptional regulator AlpA
MTPLLPLSAVAAHLGVSLRLVQKMTRAAEMQAEVQAGKRRIDDVPPDLVGYINSGFPAPVRIGKSIRRIRQEELEQWLK